MPVLPESDRTMDALARDVSFLGRVLGDVLREQGGEDLYRAVEDLRQACRHMRHHHCDAALAEVRERVSSLPLHLAGEVVRAFTVYFHLINMAEENHRLRRLAEREAARRPAPRQDSILEVIERLHHAGATADEVHGLLDNLCVRPVFTAHPTEARRMTLLRHLRAIADLVAAMSDETLPPSRRVRAVEDLYARVTTLWQTNELRLRRQTVLDEVANGLWYFDTSVFDAVAAMHRDLRDALHRWYPDLANGNYRFLEFGSWIGGDRDGNPFVTAAVTEETLRSHKRLVLTKYEQALVRLHDQLSSSTSLISASDAVFQLAQGDETGGDRRDEPYSVAVSAILARVRCTRDAAEGDGVPYASPHELLADLEVIAHSLRLHRGARIADSALLDLMNQVRTFGFHLARLDIRQHRDRHLDVLDAVFARESQTPFRDLEEPQKRHLILQALAEGRVVDRSALSEAGQETLCVFDTVAALQDEIGVDAVNTYIVSMTTDVSDLLAVLLLARIAATSNAQVSTPPQLQIVPLLETEDDLRRAPALMAELWRTEAYRAHLQAWGNRQTIMIGYSDSDKDAGYVTSNWMLYQAQRDLTEVARNHGVAVTFFHGRGGAIGRGGGPLARAILGQPAGTVQGRLQVTEQGEVLFTRYASPDIAHRHLEQVIGAVITASSRLNRPAKDIGVWEQRMADLSDHAGRAYRALVNEDPRFVTFFEEGTPLRSIIRLRIASRPSRRREGTLRLQDLRAIPWVFSWTQARYGLPGWFGLGSALAQGFHEDGEDALQAMYRGWPFFHWLVDAAQISLGKADFTVAGAYAALVADPDIRERYWNVIQREHERTRSGINTLLLQERLLDTWPVLQRSIELRNPYVDPMSFIQIDAIERVRAATDEDVIQTLRTVIDRSVAGIAAGLQNTG